MTQGRIHLSIHDPQLVHAITTAIDILFDSLESYKPAQIEPPSFSLTQTSAEPQLILGDNETVITERLTAISDLYYLYQHEAMGIFRLIAKLRSLVKAGGVRLASVSAATALSHFDHNQVLRYTHRERLRAYAHTFGYGIYPATSDTNPQFHGLLYNLVKQIGLLWHHQAYHSPNPHLINQYRTGSIAVVRRAASDLRQNLATFSFGQIHMMRVEIMPLLDEALYLLASDDMKQMFGADNLWDTIQAAREVYFDEPRDTLARQQLAAAGRHLLHWLAQPYLLQEPREMFEAQVQHITGYAQDWLSAAAALDSARHNRAPRRPPMLLDHNK